MPLADKDTILYIYTSNAGVKTTSRSDLPRA
jgi:hypothetical protein